ncbi:hypothetical protein ACI6Q2_15580 [Chitinophagaceae bacterium LWZ2-11]
MKATTYQNMVLTIIAVCLITIVLSITGIIPPAKVNVKNREVNVNINDISRGIRNDLPVTISRDDW